LHCLTRLNPAGWALLAESVSSISKSCCENLRGVGYLGQREGISLSGATIMVGIIFDNLLQRDKKYPDILMMLAIPSL
jgi:hypothetical protein